MKIIDELRFNQRNIVSLWIIFAEIYLKYSSKIPNLRSCYIGFSENVSYSKGATFICCCGLASVTEKLWLLVISMLMSLLSDLPPFRQSFIPPHFRQFLIFYYITVYPYFSGLFFFCELGSLTMKKLQGYLKGNLEIFKCLTLEQWRIKTEAYVHRVQYFSQGKQIPEIPGVWGLVLLLCLYFQRAVAFLFLSKNTATCLPTLTTLRLSCLQNLKKAMFSLKKTKWILTILGALKTIWILPPSLPAPYPRR